MKILPGKANVTPNEVNELLSYGEEKLGDPAAMATACAWILGALCKDESTARELIAAVYKSINEDI
jgi:hypothetical protein